MIQKPKWKINLRMEYQEPNLIFLLSDTEHHVLNGDLYYRMAPLINGQNSIKEIAEFLSRDFPFYEVNYAINRLAQKGYVTESVKDIPTEVESLCHLFNLDSFSSFQRLTTTQIHVLSLDNLDKNFFEDNLRKFHAQLTATLEDADLLVVLTPDYLHPDIEHIYEYATAHQKSWVLIKPNGLIPWLGPLFAAEDSTKCWKCLSQRLNLHRRLEKTLQHQKQLLHTLYPPVLPLPSTIINIATLEVLKWVLKGENVLLRDHVITLDTHSLEITKHKFIKRPQCKHCGDPTIISKRIQQPIHLQTRPKSFNADGSGSRAVTPEKVLETYGHHISSVTGVIAYLVKYQGEIDNDLINTYATGVNVQFAVNNYDSLKRMLKGGDGGKGSTPAQSKASALGESIERYSGSFHGDEYSLRATYKELIDSAVYPNEYLNFSESQYKNRQAFNRLTKTSSYNLVCPQFDETEVINWTPVWSLTNQVHKFFPTDYCYYGASNSNFSATPANSNGCAAGSNLEEAILQGFMELVERDSVSIWWYNRLKRPAVDLKSFNNDYVNRLKDFYDSIDRDLWVLDITTDLDIPSFVAISRHRTGPREDIIYGFGAHFDPQIGLVRALTEVNQLLSSFSVSENGQPPVFNEESDDWWQNVTLASQPYLSPDPDQKPRTLSSYPVVKNNDLLDDVLYCVEIARQNNLEVFVLDQTQPDVGLSVARVIVPGLRHFWRRLGPGRLYDVPVKMGWLKEPLTEEDINPYSVFI